jgi:hypothetical protein
MHYSVHPGVATFFLNTSAACCTNAAQRCDGYQRADCRRFFVRGQLDPLSIENGNQINLLMANQSGS